MRLARAGLVTAGLLLAAATPASAAIFSTPANGRLGENVVVADDHVPTADNSYEPAYYVDWKNGACPSSVGAARTKAIGDTTRGLGPVKITGNGDSRTYVEVSAKLTLEQRAQRVCFYGGGGALAGERTIDARVVIPPLDLGKQVKNWSMGAVATVTYQGHKIENSLGFAIFVRFQGTKALRFSHLSCKRKRFDMTPSLIHLGSNGTISYNGPVKADNSNNYDAPIPLKYGGHASLHFRATMFVGAAPLVDPITGITGQVSGKAAKTLGSWGVPVQRVNARFSAPGFRPFSFEPGCASHLKALFAPSVDAPAMIGQGTASLGDGINQVGKPQNTRNFPPLATFSTDGKYHSVSAGTGSVHFSSQSVDDDDGIASEAWDFGDGTSGEGHEVDHEYTADGTYTVVLTVTDHHGLKDSYTAQAYVDG